MKEVLCYFGHLKSGSTWISHIMYRTAIEMGQPLLYEQLGLKNTVDKINAGNVSFLISQSTSYKNVLKIGTPFKGFHVIRDPRDIIVSAYFSFLKTHPIGEWSELKQFRGQLEEISFDEGLIKIMDFNSKVLHDISSWDYHNSDILEIRFEDLIGNPQQVFIKIFTFLNIVREASLLSDLIGFYNRLIWKLSWKKLLIKQNQISIGALSRIQSYWSFKKMSKGRKQGQEDINSHFRKGESGDWKNHFTERHKDYFKVHYGQMLIDLGYERNLNW